MIAKKKENRRDAAQRREGRICRTERTKKLLPVNLDGLVKRRGGKGKQDEGWKRVKLRYREIRSWRKSLTFTESQLFPGTDSSGVGQVEQSRLIRGWNSIFHEWNFPDAINQCSLRWSPSKFLLIYAENIVPGGWFCLIDDLRKGCMRRRMSCETLRGRGRFILRETQPTYAFDAVN